MREVLSVCIAVIALAGTMTYPATGFEPVSGPLTEHENILRYQDRKPTQPMNVTDEAAQAIGLHDGRWDVIGPEHAGLMPNVSGGIDRGGPTLKLQWRLGP